MEKWVTISQKNFHSEKSLEYLLNYHPEAIRINNSRESTEFVEFSLKFLKRQNFPLENVYLDIRNRKNRLFSFSKTNLSIHLNSGDHLYLQRDKNISNDILSFIPTNLEVLNQISKNDILVLGDGEVELEVFDKSDSFTDCVVLNSGDIDDGVSIYLKKNEKMDFHISYQEDKFIKEILQKYPVSLMISFVRNIGDLLKCKNEFPNCNTIIPKIETTEAIVNLKAILKFAPSIILARGDLAQAVGLYNIGMVQNYLINESKTKPNSVIVASEILCSLKYRCIPTRSEIGDISNLILNGVKGFLLTNETAAFTNPFLVIDTLIKISESCQNFNIYKRDEND